MARKNTRVAKRTSLLHAASRVELPSTCDVCIVGGGAAGLVAAIVAAEKGARVVVLDRDLECGRTILATGNGRCNFVNTNLDPERYNDPAFVAAACGPTWLDDVLGFFASCGLAWAKESEGRLYPLSRQAASVRNVLLTRARKAGVLLAPAREVTRVSMHDGEYTVAYQEQWDATCTHTIEAPAVVVSVGGSFTSLYKELGLASTPPTPLLCPLACDGPALSTLDGRRVRATVRLIRNHRVVAQEEGEVLFRNYGLSGIALFNLSRHTKPGDELALDLIPTLSLDDAQHLGALTLDGILDPVIAQVLIQEAGSPRTALALAKNLAYTVSGTAETDHAQVHRGGLVTSQFSPATLESHSIPGMFACGEALDVDGPCGGFNLAWAWKSGMVAGTAAAEEATQCSK